MTKKKQFLQFYCVVRFWYVLTFFFLVSLFLVFFHIHCSLAYSFVIPSYVFPVLSCSIMSCLVLYYTVLHCTLVHCTVPYCTVLYCHVRSTCRGLMTIMEAISLFFHFFLNFILIKIEEKYRIINFMLFM
jgi:hypothetical protein